VTQCCALALGRPRWPSASSEAEHAKQMRCGRKRKRTEECNRERNVARWARESQDASNRTREAEATYGFNVWQHVTMWVSVIDASTVLDAIVACCDRLVLQ
jgi:hypothetical protein